MITARTKSGLALLVCLVFVGVVQSTDEIPDSLPKLAERKDYYGDPLPPGVLVRMGTVRLRHFGATAVFSADGKTLVSAGLDHFVRHWDLATGKQISCTKMQTVLSADNPFRDPTLSPNGKILAIGASKNVCLYDTETGKEIRNLPIDENRRVFVNFSNDNKKVALVILHTENRIAIEVYDLAAEKHISITSDQIREAAFAPDGRTFALIESKFRGKIRTFDALTGKELASVASDRWQTLEYAPDGQSLAFAGQNERISIRDPKTLEEKASIEGGPMYRLAFSPDGAILAGWRNTSVAFYEVASGREIRSLEGLHGDGFGFSPNGKVFGNWGGLSRDLALWDVKTGQRLQYRPGTKGGGPCMAVSADGKLVASGSNDPFLDLWESTTGKLVRSLKGSNVSFRTCAFSPDGQWLIGADTMCTLFMWETQTGKEVRRFSIKPAKGPGVNGQVDALQFTPDGKQIVALFHWFDRTATSEAQVWDAASGEKVAHRPYKISDYSKATSKGGLSIVFDVNAAFTPDGLAVTSGGNDSGLIVEETTTGRHLNLIPGNLGRPIAFSLDGHFLAAAILAPQDDPFNSKAIGICVAELLTGKEVLRLDQDEINSLAFSPDGSRLATADKKALRLWDLATGKQIREHLWQKEMIDSPKTFPARHIAFMPDGQTVATRMRDGSVLLWDMARPKNPAKGITKNFEKADVEKLWTDLGSEEASIAYRAAMKAIQSPHQAVQALKDRLKAADPLDANRVKSLLAELDSSEFATREKAVQELVRLGEEVEPVVRQALEGMPSEEVRRRIQTILETPRPVPSGETLRALRAIYILDRLGTQEAREVLKTMASGPVGARQTREAKESLERFSRRVK